MLQLIHVRHTRAHQPPSHPRVDLPDSLFPLFLVLLCGSLPFLNTSHRLGTVFALLSCFEIHLVSKGPKTQMSPFFHLVASSRYGFSLLSSRAPLFLIPSIKIYPHTSQPPMTTNGKSTHVAADSPSPPSSQPHTSPIDISAQTSSSPRGYRRSKRTQCSFRHRTESGSRNTTLGLCSLCKARPAFGAAHLWRRWRGLGGGRRCGWEGG